MSVSSARGTSTLRLPVWGVYDNHITSQDQIKIDTSLSQCNNNNNTIELAEYIVDPTSKTTYLKGKFIGKGGFARVHELTDLTTNKVYAGKIIAKSRLTKPHQKEKILREVRLHKTLKHKNVVGFHHFFEDENNVYIILEYCGCKSLVHTLKHRRTLTEPEVRFYIRQLTEGVEYIHSRRVIHRDLKLGNMLLTDDVTVKVGDFGLANSLDWEQDQRISICGTPNYIAPEVLNRQGHGYEADIWAMGCIMYAMLVGQPPFETSTLKETYDRIANNDYTIPPLISEPARHLIQSLLQPQPRQRPTLSQILSHDFFSSGYMPKSLSPMCCSSTPYFPLSDISNRVPDPPSHVTTPCSPVRSLCAEIKKVSPCPSLARTPDDSKVFPGRGFRNKDSGLHVSALRQKISSVLCTDKYNSFKKPKFFSTSTLYQILSTCLENIPEDVSAELAPVDSSHVVFVTKWIDYSNKYGFGFQLSDRSVGVLFNDSTRISFSADRSRVEYTDACGKLTGHPTTSIPSSLQDYFTLLKYFAQYMDENLTEGGDTSNDCDILKKKVPTPTMKRWVRTPKAIIMQLSTSTIQINFFKDHTKIILSSDRQEALVTYINEDRRALTYSLAEISERGCSPCVRERLLFSHTVLREFADLDREEN